MSPWKRRGAWTLGLLLVAVGGLFAASAWSKAHRPKVSERVLQRAETAWNPAGSDTVAVSWTGVAGTRLEAAGTTLLIDPYVTRHGLAEFARPIDADEPTLARAFPKADAILIGHSHHDHLGDAPSIVRRTKATIYGSPTSCALARGLGVPAERCVAFKGGDRLTVGPFEIEIIEGQHGRSALGVPFPGSVEESEGEPYLWQMKMGGAFSFVVRAKGLTLYHQGSAGLSAQQRARLRGLAPDLALLCLALREGTPGWNDALLGELQPKRVMPIHHDDFFGAVLDDAVPILPSVDLPGFEAEARKRLGQQALVEPKPFERVELQGASSQASPVP